MTDIRNNQDLKSRAVKWLDNIDTEGGVMLLHEAGASPFAVSIASINVDYNIQFISGWLCYKLGIKPRDEVFKNKIKPFREEFPFLNDKSCPMELEALVSRKFARYHAYAELHRNLRFCSSLAEATSIARNIIESYLENRMIWKELHWYQEHHSILGQHPIFAEFAHRHKLNSMPIKELMIRKRQLEMNIWRTKNEIKKGDKPHLLAVRTARLEGYIRELEDINRLLT